MGNTYWYTFLAHYDPSLASGASETSVELVLMVPRQYWMTHCQCSESVFNSIELYTDLGRSTHHNFYTEEMFANSYIADTLYYL